ncbi:MAG: hypothetical protein RR603_00080 [Kurthia sp.]
MSNGLKSRYIVFQDLKMDYSHNQVKRFCEMWRAGYSTVSIAKKFNCKTVEIDLLATDQLLKNKIQQRPNGFSGTKEIEDEKIRIEVQV